MPGNSVPFSCICECIFPGRGSETRIQFLKEQPKRKSKNCCLLWRDSCRQGGWLEGAQLLLEVVLPLVPFPLLLWKSCWGNGRKESFAAPVTEMWAWSVCKPRSGGMETWIHSFQLCDPGWSPVLPEPLFPGQWNGNTLVLLLRVVLKLRFLPRLWESKFYTKSHWCKCL